MSAVLVFHDVCAPVHGDELGGPWTFAVEPGTCMAMVASPSVADTVMALCTGMVAPTRGRVTMLGAEPATLPRFRRHALLRRTGVAFQREGLVSNLTLEANLVVPLVFASGHTPQEARAMAREAMTDTGLAPYAGKRPGGLTREVRIMGAVVRAALHSPELLLLEHLTSGLPDTHAQRALDWCRARCQTMVVLVPGPNPALDRCADGWLPTLQGPKEEGLKA